MKVIRYLVGGICLLFGIIDIGAFLWLVFVLTPQIAKIYREFNANGPFPLPFFLFYLPNLIIGMGDLYVGIKCFRSEKIKYLIIAVLVLIITPIVAMFISLFLAANSISPINTLTGGIK